MILQISTQLSLGMPSDDVDRFQQALQRSEEVFRFPKQRAQC